MFIMAKGERAVPGQSYQRDCLFGARVLLPARAAHLSDWARRLRRLRPTARHAFCTCLASNRSTTIHSSSLYLRVLPQLRTHR
jgi:hypothetical protein